MSEKQIRKTLQYLQQDQLVVRAVVVERRADVAAVNAAAGKPADEDDIPVKSRGLHYTYVCIDYPRAVDIIRLRIHSIRAALKASAEEEHLVQEFFCTTPACNGRRYTSLDAADIIHPETGAFHCEACGAALALDTGDDGDEGMNSFERARQRREEARQLIVQFDTEIKPLEEAIARACASGADPPDYGSLRDFVDRRTAVAREEAKLARAAELKGTAAGAAAAKASARRNGVFDFLEDTEFEVQLEGDGRAAAPTPDGAPGPSTGAGPASMLASRKRKVIAPWEVRKLQQQQQQQQAGGAAAAGQQPAAQAAAEVAEGAAAAGPSGEDRFAAEYVRQFQAYLAAARKQQAAAAPAVAGEAGAAQSGGAAAAAAAADDDDEWEDV